MRPLNLKDVQAKTGGDFPKVEPGGYLCKIVRVEDVPKKEYLVVDLDIASGELTGYYADLERQFNFWGARLYWSYKEANLGYFKGNVTAVEESNPGYEFDSNEQALVGKLVGAVFGIEQYYNKYNDLKESVRPRYLCAAERIQSGDYDIPKPKLPREDTASDPYAADGWMPTDEDVPPEFLR